MGIGQLARMGEYSSLANLTSKPTGNRPLGRPRRRRDDNIRTNFKGAVVNMWN